MHWPKKHTACGPQPEMHGKSFVVYEQCPHTSDTSVTGSKQRPEAMDPAREACIRNVACVAPGPITPGGCLAVYTIILCIIIR